MADYASFQHIFLIAMPQMSDSIFAQSVVYLWQYNKSGAVGAIINKPVGIPLGELLEQLDIKEMSRYAENYATLYGGPVASRQPFVIRRQPHEIKDEAGNSVLEITVSSTRQDLIKLAMCEWAHEAIVTLGCASWQPGQLDKELANNDWLVAPFNESILFGAESGIIGEEWNSVDIWYNAAARSGIDLHRLSPDIGHA